MKFHSDRQRTRDHRLRTGFTLIELLIVVAIIGILMALSASAVIRYVGVQQHNNTETTLRKVNTALNARWSSVVHIADKETIPPALYPTVLSMANNDERRARIIWIKLRLRQEFPINFAEAYNPGPLPYISTYRQAALKAFPTPPPPPPGGPTESAACLLMALERATGGGGLSASDLGSAAVLDTNGDNVNEIVDGWGQPIKFIRWPLEEAFLNPGGPQPGPKNDPGDPEGLLTNPTWLGSGGKSTFEGLCHLVPYTGPRSYKLQPVIVSAGPNRVMGLNNLGGIVGSANDSNDNIYSYNLPGAGFKGE